MCIRDRYQRRVRGAHSMNPTKEEQAILRLEEEIRTKNKRREEISKKKSILGDSEEKKDVLEVEKLTKEDEALEKDIAHAETEIRKIRWENSQTAIIALMAVGILYFCAAQLGFV
eukprot:TRINITY_DN741_c0_g1_i3.p1 TRINITY_DN741_c0_g1~~TRINITY_DN741_c0_g1_i3.p1  ORF type:complete len:115 (-),score=39.03 TRINITY_DN741_c0_g1_i3:142-486(-)